MNIEILKQRQRLDHLFKLVRALDSDPELQAHWACYLCVLASGLIETAVRASLADYARGAAAPAVARYVASCLEYFQNPKMEKIVGLIRSFDPNWASELVERTEGEPKDAVDSIVANRNNISHGRSVSISFAQMTKYYQGSLQAIEAVVTLLPANLAQS
jgi:hypothetical protein